MDDLHRYSALLDDFRDCVPLRPERAPTIMEIAGYPHYENVCSNILAFFLDPDKPHGLGTLFLDALAEVGGIKDPEGLMGGEVEREVVTEAKKRIDILILSDSHAVLIENKIFASTTNPLDEYATFLEKKKETNKYKFLLTLTRTAVGEKQKFRNITYQELVDRIRGLIGKYVADADTRYLTFMLDFLNTLDYLQGDKAVNEKFLKFLRDNREDAEAFLGEYKAVKSDLEANVKNLHGKLSDAGISQTGLGKHVSRRKYGNGQYGSGQLEHVLSYTIESGAIKDTKIKVRATIDPSGWRIEVSLEGNDPTKQIELGEVLEGLNLEPFERNSERFVSGGPDADGFGYGTDLDTKILPVMCRVVRGLAADPESRNTAEDA